MSLTHDGKGNMTTQPIRVHTDGSSIGNPGPGGWAFSYEDHDHHVLVSGGEEHSTNNRMELVAVVEALEWLCDKNIHVISDSLLTVKIGQGEWKAKSNLDLWDKFKLAKGDREVTLEWVKAHCGDPSNDEVDKAARAEARLISEGVS